MVCLDEFALFGLFGSICLVAMGFDLGVGRATLIAHLLLNRYINLNFRAKS